VDYAGFDLNLIVAFDALMAERHVTRAAIRIGLTQPAMSAALSRLRKATRDELFVRGPKGLAPTPRAHDLIAPFRRALDTVSGALDLQTRFHPKEASQTFTLALSDHPAHRLLPHVSEIVSREGPGIDLRVRGFSDRQNAIHLLDEGIADVAVGVLPGNEARILTSHLFTERFVCIARRGSSAASALRSVEEFAAARHILVSPEGEEHGVVDVALAERGMTRRLGVVLSQMYAAPHLVANSNNLIATLMEGVVANSGFSHDLVVAAPPLELPTVDFHLLWHRRTDQHPAHQWLRACIAEAAIH
jgi:DNA-binding transcriptional LysR family regulator